MDELWPLFFSTDGNRSSCPLMLDQIRAALERGDMHQEINGNVFDIQIDYRSGTVTIEPLFGPWLDTTLSFGEFIAILDASPLRP